MIEALIFYLKSRDKEAAANGDQGRTIAPGEDIVTEGSHPGHSILMIEGLFVATNRWPTLQTYYGIAGAGRLRRSARSDSTFAAGRCARCLPPRSFFGGR